MLVSIVILLIAQVSDATAIYRNHPLVLGKPMVCSVVLTETHLRPSSKLEYLGPLGRLVDQVNGSAPPVFLLNGRRNWDYASEGIKLQTLLTDLERIVPNQISWGHATLGWTAIQARMEKRLQLAEGLRGEVNSRLRNIQPEFRLSHPLVGGVAVIGYLSFFSEHELLIQQMRQIGIWPINRGGEDPYYEVDFLSFARTIQRAALSEDPAVQIYRSATPIAHRHYRDIVNCASTSAESLAESTTASCILSRMNNIDGWLNRETRALVKEQENAATRDLLWAKPTALTEDIFIYDKENPVLLSFLRIFARDIDGNKPSPGEEEDQWELSPDLQPIRIPSRRP